MKPEFEVYRGDKSTRKDVTSVRLPAGLKGAAELIALGEGDSLTGLLIEGLARVVQDRRSDPNFGDSLRTALDSRAQAAQEALAADRSQLETFLSGSTDAQVRL